MLIDAKRLILIALFVAAFFTYGCGKLPKPEEVLPAVEETEEQPDAEPPPTVVREQPVQTAEEVVSDFVESPPRRKTDEALLAIAEQTEQIAEIEELLLGGSAVSDLGAAALPRFPALKRVHLSGSRVSGKSLEYANAAPNLEVLGFNAIPLEDAALKALESNATITELSLAGTSIGDAAFESLATLEHLQVLDVSANDQVLGRTFTDLVKRKRFGELRSLSANNSGFGYYGLLEIKSLRNLEHLSAADSFVTDEALTGLRGSKSLKTLHLHNNRITSAGLSQLRGLTQLEELRLSGNRAIGDEALKFLRGLKQLRELSLGGTGCSEAAVHELKHRHLKSTRVLFGGKEL